METPADTSRRRLLGLGAVAAGTLAVTAVEGLAAGPAVAADGDPVLLAATNQANNPTVIEITDSGQPGLHVIARSDDGAAIGENSSNDGYGVRANGSHIGLNAVGGTTGVYSVSDYGTALRALTYDGVAVEASTAVDAGHALNILGAAHFSRSGVATVPSGQRSVTVPAGARAGSSVLATIQDRQAGRGGRARPPGPHGHDLAEQERSRGDAGHLAAARLRSIPGREGVARRGFRFP